MEAAYQRWVQAVRDRDNIPAIQSDLTPGDLHDLVVAAFDDAPEMVQRQIQLELDSRQRIENGLLDGLNDGPRSPATMRATIMLRELVDGYVPTPETRAMRQLRAELDALLRDNTEERAIEDGGERATYANYLSAVERGDTASERGILQRMHPDVANSVRTVIRMQAAEVKAADSGRSLNPVARDLLDSALEKIQQIEGTRIKPARPTASSAMIRQALRDHRGDIVKAAAQVMRQL